MGTKPSIQPWKVTKSRYLVEDRPWLRLRVDTCRLPNGRQIDNFYVLEVPDWVCVVAITTDGQVVMERQYRHGVRRVLLELPGGSMEPGEPPLEAVQRELLEETGYGGGAWLATGKIAPEPDKYPNSMYCFLAQGVERLAEPALDSTEDLQVELYPFEEIVRMAQDGRIAQSMHVAALFFALSRLGWVQPPAQG